MLKSFDIVVLEGRWWRPEEAAVMWRSMSRFSHCVIAAQLNPKVVVNPNIGGVRYDYFTEYKGRRGVVCRYKKELDIPRLTYWLQHTVHNAKGYDYKAWLGFVTNCKEMEDKDHWFCSELAYWLYQANDLKLTKTDLSFPFPSLFFDHNDFANIYEGVF